MTELAEYVRNHTRFENSRTVYEANIEAGVAWARKKSTIKDNFSAVSDMNTNRSHVDRYLSYPVETRQRSGLAESTVSPEEGSPVD